jgi:hypothetical protein
MHRAPPPLTEAASTSHATSLLNYTNYTPQHQPLAAAVPPGKQLVCANNARIVVPSGSSVAVTSRGQLLAWLNSSHLSLWLVGSRAQIVGLNRRILLSNNACILGWNDNSLLAGNAHCWVKSLYIIVNTRIVGLKCSVILAGNAHC